MEEPLACPLASGRETPLGLVCMSAPSAIAAPEKVSARRSTAVEPKGGSDGSGSEDSGQTAVKTAGRQQRTAAQTEDTRKIKEKAGEMLSQYVPSTGQ